MESIDLVYKPWYFEYVFVAKIISNYNLITRIGFLLLASCQVLGNIPK